MKNSELWLLAEENKINKGDVFIDEEGNEIIFTGTSFQVYFTEKDQRYQFVGLCLNDKWRFLKNDLREIELQESERF